MTIRHIELPPGQGGEKDPNDYKDRPEVLEQAKESNPPAFQLVRAGTLKATAPKWQIRGLLEADSLALFFGDPACGKSFAGIDLACCISTGTDFHGHKVKTGPAVYVAGEGHNGLARRFNAWSIRHQTDLGAAPLFVSQTPAQLCDPASIVHVIAAVDRVASECGSPALVVVDTVARNFGPGDENSTKDMGAFIQAADMIRSAHHCAMLLIHHTGHGDKTRARGAMALKGSLDAEYRMDRDELGVVRLEATKMKDAPLPDPMAFHLRSVELPLIDDEGQPVTSAVLDRTDYEPPSQSPAEGKGKWQAAALNALRRVTDEHRRNKEQAGHDPDAARVSLDDWRSACIESGMPRQRFHELKDKLSSKGVVSIKHGFVSCA